MEALVILEKKYKEGIDKKASKGEIVTWSEAMRRFNLTGEELKAIIKNGTMVTNANVDYFIDEALTY